MTTAAPAHRWRLVPRLLLRRAGFGFELLETVGDPAVREAAAGYRDAVQRFEAARAAVLGPQLTDAVSRARSGADRTTLRALSALRSQAGRRRALGTLPAADAIAPALAGPLAGYAAAHTALDTADAALGRARRDELATRAERLRKRLDPDVLDAIIQLAPSYYDSLVRWTRRPVVGGPDRRDRSMLRRLYLYYQRLASKNETTSFFGPLVHGHVDEKVTGVAFGPDTAEGVTETRAFLAFWAVCSLAKRLAADPAVGPLLPVTRVAAARLDGDALTLPDGRRVRLPQELAALASAVDDTRSATALAGHLGVAAEAVAEGLARLERIGAVRTWPEPPSVMVQPLDHLAATAGRHAAHTDWPRHIAGLRDRLDAFGAARGHAERRIALQALEEDFAALADTDARRAGGRMYADRMVAYIDCRGDLAPVRIGGDTAGWMADQLAPVLDFGAVHGELLHRAHQDLGLAVLESAGVTRMPYDRFIRLMGDRTAEGALLPRLEPVRLLHRALEDLVRSRLDGRVAVLDPAALRALGTPGPRPRFASPDVLLREDGTTTLVLGEIHPYVFAWGSQGLFAEDEDALRADFSRDLSPWGGSGRMATVARRRRHKGLVAATFPGRFIEVTAVATDDRSRTLAITGLTVEADGDTLRLTDGHGEVTLYAGEDDHPHLAVFAPPPASRLPLIRFGDFAPRVVIGDLIAQRACWWLPAGALTGSDQGPGGDEMFARVQRMRALDGLPRWVYAHVPGEPKPICVDLDAPLAVEVLASTAGAARPGEVALSEMLPEPGALWLRKQQAPTTSELRIAIVREGE